MVNAIENISKEKQEQLWLNTISGSQLWKLFKSDKEYKLLILSKLNIYKPVFSKFSQLAMKRGKDRESIIIERLKDEYFDYKNICKNNKTLYSEKYRISANPDAIDEKAKIIFEIKSSSSAITKEYAIYQLSLYKLLLSLYDEKYFDYKYLLVSENPKTKKIEISEPLLFESKKILDKVKQFWYDVTFYQTNTKNNNKELIDKLINELLFIYTEKDKINKRIEYLEKLLSSDISFGNKYYTYRIKEIQKVSIKEKPAHIQTRKINKLVIGEINNGKKST